MINADSLTHAQEIRVLGYALPIVSSPYSGALKIWALAPILMFFRISPPLVLTLNILFGTIYLLALYWALLAVVHRNLASLVFIIPFVDTNYLLTVPVDICPSNFQYISIALAIGTLLRYMSKSEVKFNQRFPHQLKKRYFTIK